MRAAFLAPRTEMVCNCRAVATETRDAATQENLRGRKSGRQQQLGDWGLNEEKTSPCGDEYR